MNRNGTAIATPVYGTEVYSNIGIYKKCFRVVHIRNGDRIKFYCAIIHKKNDMKKNYFTGSSQQ